MRLRIGVGTIYLIASLLGVSEFGFTQILQRASDGYIRQAGFDVLHYQLHVEVSDTNNVIHGKAILTVRRLDLQDSTLALDFKNMPVTSIQVGEAATRYFSRAGQIEVFLPPGIDTLHLTIQYQGEPADGLYIRENKFQRRTIFADNWPDRGRYWFPGIDHPADKATVEFYITAPERYAVVANGRLEEERHNLNGTKTWRWRTLAPIPTYCMVFGAAEFAVQHLEEVSGVPVSYYVFPNDAAAAEPSFGRTAQILRFFSEMIGPYPYEKLALVQSSTRFGGMENASAIFFAEAALGSSGTEGTSAHEIAHQWFGDAVTEGDWHHLWLSEGFATYFEALFYEHADGESRFREKMRRNRENYLKFAEKKLTPILDTTVTNYSELLNANNYPKAAWVLHMLRNQIGDEKFWRGIREYYRVYQNGNVLTDDFRWIMEQASGDDLRWFFRQWLQQPGHPVIKFDWRWLPKEKSVALTIRQIQPNAFFRLPLEIEFASANGKTRHHAWMEKAQIDLKLPQDKPPERVLLDPEEKILMTVAD